MDDGVCGVIDGQLADNIVGPNAGIESEEIGEPAEKNDTPIKKKTFFGFGEGGVSGKLVVEEFENGGGEKIKNENIEDELKKIGRVEFG